MASDPYLFTGDSIQPRATTPAGRRTWCFAAGPAGNHTDAHADGRSGRAPKRTTAPAGRRTGCFAAGAGNHTDARGRTSQQTKAGSTVALRAARASSSPRNDKNSREMKWGRQRRSPTISPRQRGETVASTRRQGSHQRLPSSRAGARYSARANANEFSPADREGAQFRGRGMRPGWLAWTGGEMGGRQRYLQDHHGG